MFYLASGGLNLLNVNPGLIIWTLVTFLVVVLILGKFAWKPIIESLDARADKIKSDLERAENLKKESEDLLTSYNEKISQAKEEAVSIVNEAKSDATALRNKMMAETQSEVKSLKDQSIREIELTKQKAVQELQEHVVDLSVAIAGQIIEKQLKAEDHSDYVKLEIAKLKNTSL